jgi:hypothetical protein
MGSYPGEALPIPPPRALQSPRRHGRGASISDHARSDLREAWLRSRGWHQTEDGLWTGLVAATHGGRYRPMTLEHAFDVSVRRCVIDQELRVEVAGDHVRLASPWRALPPEPPGS